MNETVRRHVARPTTAGGHTLAEGPLWDPEHQRVIWVDIPTGHLHTGQLTASGIAPSIPIRFDETVGAAVPGPDGTFLIAARHDLRHVTSTGETLTSWPVLATGVQSRLNDGACDPAGRFLVGSLAQDARTGAEVLVRLDATGEITVLDDDLTLSNGLGWSPDGDVLYSVESTPGTIFKRAYDVDTGAVGPREVLLDIADGTPDGLTIDIDGNLWLAVWGAGEVRCLDPDGRLLAVVDVDAPNTTSVAFVGPDHDLLMITTARAELSGPQLEHHPDSGRVFLADVGTRGLPATPWRPPTAPRLSTQHTSESD